MAVNGGVSWQTLTEKIDGGFDGGFSPGSDDVHVLAVDDSLVDRKVIERLLKITSCKVTAVDSGRRALEYLGLDEEQSNSDFEGLKVDMIITDYCMPGMTGYELLKKVKGSSGFSQIPVVIMSSENVLARIDRCLEEGAEDFIVKPVKLSDVERLKHFMKKVPPIPVAGGNKRKLPDSLDLDPQSPTSISPSPSSPSTLHSTSSISTTPSVSPSPSIQSISAPSSPSSLESPTSQSKINGSDESSD